MYNDTKTSQHRIGERNPHLLLIAKSIVWAGILTMTLVGIVIIITDLKTAENEYSLAHSFQPVHLPAYYTNNK